jgi:hypothetical protein
MNSSNSFENTFTGVFQDVPPAQQQAAQEALGIPSAAKVHPMDVSKLALFVAVQPGGMASTHATIPKRQAAALLRNLADQWDAEWKAEERAEQQRVKHERVAAERRRRDARDKVDGDRA